MFGREYRDTLKAYQDMIKILQAEKTELFNRLMARDLQELQQLQAAFPQVQQINDVKVPVPSFDSEETGDYDESHIGEIADSGVNEK